MRKFKGRARRRYRKAAWINGEGAFGVLAHCGVLTITLWDDMDLAQSVLRRSQPCGGRCAGLAHHEIVDFRTDPEREADGHDAAVLTALGQLGGRVRSRDVRRWRETAELAPATFRRARTRLLRNSQLKFDRSTRSYGSRSREDDMKLHST